ncbi:hypothetical protein J5N97_012673 [Dioscorea zingiberensis]|uniref:FAD-binding 8 domain-containing protein n=1 Tax=Dioscorea zingiberensis TaxID=325984 RepID=A0A9D5CQH4_9LILI|nr:hypothetical protein J5N97_012673 [Dioscorea zingiberensis]
MAAGAVFLFILDRFLRFCQSRPSVDIISAACRPCGTTELILSKPANLRYNALSFVFLQVRELSWLQWHPFSVSSSPLDGCYHIVVSANTNSQDAVSLYGLGSQWENKPPNWNGVDPCSDSWVGISCNNSRIVSMDLSYNKELTGQIPSSIGSLSKLENLILVGCSFSGEIPQEIGSLKQLVFLSLNSNKFTGRIPQTIGNLAKLYWLDLADNMLTGEIPMSDGKNSGLDTLIHTKHLYVQYL